MALTSQMLLLEILDRGIEDARIAFEIEDRAQIVGRGRGSTHDDCDVSLRVRSSHFFDAVVRAGNLGMAEAFMAGDFEVTHGTLAQFLEILLRNRLDQKIKASPTVAARVLARRVLDKLRGKADSVQRHYDIGDDLFEAFLDTSLTYSCGYADSPDDDLDTLQRNKLDRTCKKLRLQPGDHLLDIGCGFGGLLIHAAVHYGVTGTGVTLSRRHCARGAELAAAAGVGERVEIRYADYHDVVERYDKVVSVGMLEHVPRHEYRRYFRTLARVLGPGGLGLVHAVGANAASNDHDPFIQKYIFPASAQPRLSEIAVGLERNGLAILDVENFIRHYGFTATRWLENFHANHERLDPRRYDASFKRMWEYYLSCCIAAASASDAALYQVLFTNNHTLSLPLHRV